MKVDAKLQGESNSQYAYRVLKKNIMHMEMLPGETINYSEMSEALGVSRMPIREAILRLKEERLVDVYSQSSTCVSYIDYKLVQQSILIREALETAVLGSLCGRLKPADEEQIMINIKFQHLCAGEDSLRKYIYDLDNEFHQTLFTIADCDWAWRMREIGCTHHDRIRYLHMFYHLKKEGAMIICRSHEALLGCILRGDREELAQEIRKHVNLVPSDMWMKPREELSQYIINLEYKDH